MLDLETYLHAGETHVSNLVLAHYRQMELSDQELILYLQLLGYQQKGTLFPNLATVGKQMGQEQEDIYRLLQGLIDKECVKIVTTQNSQGQTVDAYDLTGVYQRIKQTLTIKTKQDQQQRQVSETQELYRLFEQEFGRPLSPIEIETLNAWMTQDHYSVELIRLALREAVLNQAYSLKYIDRILLSWERKNFSTKEQILADQQARKKRLTSEERENQSQSNEQLPKVPLYNWVDPTS